MQLAVDTDAFCKLAGFDLLEPALAALGLGLADCGRLPRLVRQLERAAWLDTVPDLARARLRAIAAALPVATPRDGGWIDRIASSGCALDAGEAALLAVVADGDAVLLMTGDKRALRALASFPELAAVLRGRVVLVEQAALLAIGALGDAEVERRVVGNPFERLDRVLASCLRASDRSQALRQYVVDVEREAPAGVLWKPAGERDL